MNTETTLAPRMGRKRIPPKGKPKTPREKLAARLRLLAGDRSSIELAKEWKVTSQAVRKWLSGQTVPDLKYWPKIAATFGIKDYRHILPESL